MVVVQAGATSASFELTTNPTSSTRWTTISAMHQDAVRQAAFAVTPPLRVSALSFPPSVTGGGSAAGRVYLNANPGVNVDVRLSTSDGTLASVPDTVTIPGYADGADFAVFTNQVAVPTPVTIFAALGDTVQSFTLVLNPVDYFTSLTVDPTSVPGGSTATGTVTLTAPALSPVGIVLFSRDEWSATVPGGVTIPIGARSATFAISTHWVPFPVDVSIGAYLYDPNGTVSRNVTIHVTRPVTLTAVGLDPSTVRAGISSTGRVTLDSPAPAGGVTVALATDSVAAMVPATVIVRSGTTTGTFTVSTVRVSSRTVATISARLDGTTLSTALAITR
jgi:trimeric autotransporter adhesin